MVKKCLHYNSTDHHRTIFLIFFFFFVFITSLVHGHTPRSHHLFVYAGCSNEKYQQNSAFEANLNSFLASAANSSPQSLYNSFSSANDTDAAIFGLYECRGDLKPADCARCVISAATQVGLVCPNSFGATIQLEACSVRYEHFDFLGKPDTSVRFKKCSRSPGGDPEFYRRRDDVLADLEGASGFRVSTSGLVEGFAQCAGDLSPSDCSACLADCVAKLKSLCGSAAAADVFLAQCYSRYWASGYYELSPDSTNEDHDVGKTVAIIVGVLAGIAILIVLLSICRKTMS